MKSDRSIKIAVLIACFMIGGNAAADVVSVAVAANFTDATREIVPLFEKATGHKAKVSYGSTGKLYSQIENGAPFQVFLAADTKRPLKAEQEGLAVVDSFFVYAKGKLVLWSTKPGLVNDGVTYLKKAAFAHLAMANPKTAPYGLAARQVMEHLGLWPQLQSKLVRGESIAQTFQFVVSGNAESGFVAYSQVKAWKGGAGSTWVIPEDYYAPIEQGAVLLKKGESSLAAKAFLDFLKSESAKAVIERYGYGLENY
jgi:molybdate transport system substrate-binding protein